MEDNDLADFYQWRYLEWLQRTFGKAAYRKFCEAWLKREKREIEDMLRRYDPSYTTNDHP